MAVLVILLFFGSVLTSLGKPTFEINENSSSTLLKSRIVGGENVSLGEMPHVVSVQYQFENTPACGGSIINENYVITAAHCTAEGSAYDFVIIAGTVNLEEPNEVRNVTEKIIHEDYNQRDSWINDICLLKVDRPFTFSPTLGPISLPEYDIDIKSGQLLTVTGYGRTNKSEPLSKNMLKANVPVLSNDECSELYQQSKFGYTVYDTHVCTFDSKAQRGSCSGDSGSSLTNSEGVMIGIVSWSEESCASTKWPSVSTRVSKYLDWIEEHAV